MRTLRIGGLLAALAGAVGCGNHYTYYDGSAPYVGGPIPAGPVATYRIAPGLGTVVQPGAQAGYGITANTGGSYRLVWTGDAGVSGGYREFYGSVWTLGQFTTTTWPCGVCTIGDGDAWNDPVPVDGGWRIDFDTFAATALKGFDFITTAEPVYFDLFIDGQRYPQLVFFPSTDATPPGAISTAADIPFGLTTM